MKLGHLLRNTDRLLELHDGMLHETACELLVDNHVYRLRK